MTQTTPVWLSKNPLGTILISSSTVCGEADICKSLVIASPLSWQKILSIFLLQGLAIFSGTTLERGVYK